MPLNQHMFPFPRFALIAIVLLLALLPGTLLAGGFGERISNGSFEEGFGVNGVGSNWTGFSNGGTADYVFADDLGAPFIFDGKHSQLFQISTIPYAVSEPDRFAGIYQTVAVVAGTPYTLTLHGMLRVLSNDPDKNNWSYIFQWGIDPFGGTDWGQVQWKDVSWNTTYDRDNAGALSHFTTTFTAPTNKITLFIRALKKFPTPWRAFYANMDGISLFGQTPSSDTEAKFEVKVPSFVYTAKPFRVQVSASDNVGVQEITLFDDGKQVARSANAVGPLTKEASFDWTPTITGTHVLQVNVRNELGKTAGTSQAVEVKPIKEFLQNGNFEGGFTPQGVARNWASFDNGGRNVIHQLYDETWKPVIASGAHAQLIEISTLGHGEFDPNAESDRVAGICQVIRGLTPQASYYTSAKGIIRITEGDKHTDDWSWVAEWGYLPVADPECAAWNTVTNWQVFPWQHVDFRSSPTKINSATYIFLAPSDTVTVYFAAWKKWAVGAREFLVNFDDVSVAGYNGQ